MRTSRRLSTPFALALLVGGASVIVIAAPTSVLRAADGCGDGRCCGDGAAGADGRGDDGPGGHDGHGSAEKGPDGGPQKPAPDLPGSSGSAPAERLLVDLGNPKCPVMGGDVDGKTWSEWNGLRVGHCCPMCRGKFAKDPAKALDAKKINWKDAAAAVKRVDDAKSPEERKEALAALEAKYKVVRGGTAKAPPTAQPAQEGSLLVDLGNAKCPIMGGDVDGKTWSEWNGLRVGHCCPMCRGKFAKDPAKALDAKKIDWKDAAAAVKRVDDAKSPEERAKALSALRAKWTVVRDPKQVPAPPAPGK